MIPRHLLMWRSGALTILLGMLGCEAAKPPMAETPPPAVTVSQPVTRDVIDYDDYEGRIAAIPTVEVRARVRGHLIKIHFQDGQIVKEDTLLFEIDPRTYEADVE